MSKIPILFLHQFKNENNLVKRILNSVKNFKNIQPIEITPEILNNEAQLKKIMEENLVKAAILPFNAKNEFDLILKNKNDIKWIQSCGTGVDAYREQFKMLKKKNVILTNTKGSSSKLLAEFAILGSLYFTKKTPFFLEKAKKKEWVDEIDKMDIIDNKKGLIIGYGSIGTEIAKKCHYGFNMQITGLKKNPKNISDEQKKITTDIISLESLNSRINEMDYIFLALPNINMQKNIIKKNSKKLINKSNDDANNLNEENKHHSKKIITKNLIKKMKKGVIIVNVGRGDVINEDDLAWGLKNDIIRGAALDVFEKEPLNKDSVLYDSKLQDKILNFCHKSDHSENLFVNRVDIVYRNVERFLKGEKLVNLVDLNEGY